MEPACNDFRASVLAAEGREDSRAELEAHAAACEPCRAWAARAATLAAALHGLPRVPAPDALLARTEKALAARSSEDAPRWGGLLAELERRRAPHVLDRLVEEELAAPLQARARRFAGDLERLPAPTALELRLFGQDPTLRVGRALRWLGAAAALLVTSILVARIGDDHRRPFEVVYELPADPHPIAASLVEGWATARIRPGGPAAEGGGR